MTDNQLLENSRETYQYAYTSFTQSKSAFETFHLRLEATELPMHQWRKPVLRHHTFLKKQTNTALRILLAAETSLRSHQTASAKSAAAAAKAEPPAPKPLPKGEYTQDVKVTIENGQTVTQYNIDPRHWIRVNAWHLVKSFRRHYYFPAAEIPAEYAFVLEHNGYHYLPTKSVYITYHVDEFQRLCHLEVDSDSSHALDGERIGYYRPSEKLPIDLPDEEEEENTDKSN